MSEYGKDEVTDAYLIASGKIECSIREAKSHVVNPLLLSWRLLKDVIKVDDSIWAHSLRVVVALLFPLTWLISIAVYINELNIRRIHVSKHKDCTYSRDK